MGAVVIIALFYTAKINLIALAAAAAMLAIMMLCNRMGLKSLILYLLMALILWYAMLLSGVHATIAGVLAAMTIPLEKTPGEPEDRKSGVSGKSVSVRVARGGRRFIQKKQTTKNN